MILSNVRTDSNLGVGFVILRKHFPKFINVMPVRVCIIMAAYGDRLGIAVSIY